MYKTGHAFTYLLRGRRPAARASNRHVVRTDQSVVNHAINEWRRRLSACVHAEGGHFERYLIIATLKITMSKWQHCKFDNLR